MTFDESLPARVPPFSQPAEINVLGSVLLDTAVLHEAAVAMLDVRDFYLERHRVIWRGMRALQAAGKPIDLDLLADELSKRGQLDEAGGAVYIAGLSDQVATAAYAEHYARIVRENTHRRDLISHAGNVMRQAYSGDLALEDIHMLAEKVPELSLGHGDGIVSLGDAVSEVLAQAETGGGPKGVPTGLADLDTRTNGLEPGRLYVLAARPGMGKSGLAFQIATHVAKVDGPVLGFNLEMPATEIGARILASEAKVSLERLTKARHSGAGHVGELSDRDLVKLREASGRLADVPLRILAKPGLPLHELLAEVRRAHQREPLSLFVLDYLQLVTTGGRGGENANQRLTEVSNSLKRLAMELNIPILALSQLSRAVEQRPNHRPQLSDLRESGSLEQDADVVAFIYRDEYYNKDTDQQGIAEIILGKQRNGPTDTVKVQFQSAFVRFADLSYATV